MYLWLFDFNAVLSYLNNNDTYFSQIVSKYNLNIESEPKQGSKRFVDVQGKYSCFFYFCIKKEGNINYIAVDMEITLLTAH